MNENPYRSPIVEAELVTPPVRRPKARFPWVSGLALAVLIYLGCVSVYDLPAQESLIGLFAAIALSVPVVCYFAVRLVRWSFYGP